MKKTNISVAFVLVVFTIFVSKGFAVPPISELYGKLVGTNGVVLAFHGKSTSITNITIRRHVLVREDVSSIWVPTMVDNLNALNVEEQELVFDGVLDPDASGKYTFIDTNVVVYDNYAYWVLANHSGEYLGPLMLKVWHPDVLYSKDRIDRELGDLAATYPEKAKLVTFGYTCHGSPLKGLVVGNTNNLIGIEGGIHPGETGGAIQLHILSSMLQNNVDLLEKVGLVVLPVVNADSRAVQVAGWPGYIRKNMRGKNLPVEDGVPSLDLFEQNGCVDLNRNFDANWETVVYKYNFSTDDPNGNTYRGEAPFSEPELCAVTNLMSRYRPKVFFDIHQGGSRMAKLFGGDIDLNRHLDFFAKAFSEGFFFDEPDKSGQVNAVNESLSPGSCHDYCYKIGLPGFAMEVQWNDKEEFQNSFKFKQTAEDKAYTCEKYYRAILNVASNLVDPVAFGDLAKSAVNGSVPIDVLANDIYADEGDIGVEIAEPPANGTATVLANNTVLYVPRNGYAGTDGFGYILSKNGREDASATVVVAVGQERLVLLPTDDTYVRNDTGDTSYGTKTELKAKETGTDEYTRRTYLRFDVPPILGTITHAKLKLYCRNIWSSSHSGCIKLAASSNWNETELTFNNAPGAVGDKIASWTAVEGSFVELDVTRAIQYSAITNSPVSFVIFQEGGDNGASYSSKDDNLFEKCPRLELVVSMDSALVVSTGDSDPGSELELDVAIATNGTMGTEAFGFDVLGTTLNAGARGGVVRLVFDAVKNISTNPATCGDKLIDGNVDRDGSGRIGVSDDPHSGGIGEDGTNHEGLRLILDASDGIAPSVKVGIDWVRVSWFSTGDRLVVVNLDTRETAIFDGSSETYPVCDFDLSALGLSVQGGSSRAVASIYADKGGFRVDGAGLLLTEPTTLLLSGLSLSDNLVSMIFERRGAVADPIDI